MKIAITTVDNPYDPIDDFDRWYAFDREKNYKTCERLALLCQSFENLGDLDELQAVEAGIDRLLAINPIGLYKKVVKKD